jgi:hypothetical protein
MRSGVLQAVLLSEIAVFSEQLGFSAVESRLIMPSVDLACIRKYARSHKCGLISGCCIDDACHACCRRSHGSIRLRPPVAP